MQPNAAWGKTVLVRMARTANPPARWYRLEAARLLSEPLQPDQALLAQPPGNPLREQSVDGSRPGAAGRASAASVFSRWPDHPASWQLQWDLAPLDLLCRWADAEAWLEAPPHDKLPEPLAARQRFWHGFSAAKQGRLATGCWRTNGGRC